MRILIAGGTAVSRRALITLFNTKPELDVVGEVMSVAQLTNQLAQIDLDIVILNSMIKNEAGVETIRAIKILVPQTAVLVLSARKSIEQVSLVAGADAFVFKGDPPRTLLTTIETIRMRREDV